MLVFLRGQSLGQQPEKQGGLLICPSTPRSRVKLLGHREDPVHQALPLMIKHGIESDSPELYSNARPRLIYPDLFRDGHQETIPPALMSGIKCVLDQVVPGRNGAEFRFLPFMDTVETQLFGAGWEKLSAPVSSCSIALRKLEEALSGYAHGKDLLEKESFCGIHEFSADLAEGSLDIYGEISLGEWFKIETLVCLVKVVPEFARPEIGGEQNQEASKMVVERLLVDLGMVAKNQPGPFRIEVPEHPADFTARIIERLRAQAHAPPYGVVIPGQSDPRTFPFGVLDRLHERIDLG